MICSIHQPNFFPWLGYFAKMAKSDVFIFLDGVQYSKGSWINRVKMLVAGDAKWMTEPISRDLDGGLIKDILFDARQPWRAKFLKTVRLNYCKAEFFSEVMPFVEELVSFETESLSAFNVNSVSVIAGRLNISTKTVLHSTLEDPRAFTLSGTERLVAICKGQGADIYLAGDGADGYEDLSKYEANALTHRKNSFVCKPYPQVGAQGGAFVPGLSVLDALFNVGFEKTRELL